MPLRARLNCAHYHKHPENPDFIAVLVISLYAWGKLSNLPSSPLRDLLIILASYQVRMSLCTMLLAKWVAQDGVVVGETESGRQELEQRVLELERRMGIGIWKSKKPETTESEAKDMDSDSRGKRFCIHCGALNDVDAVYCNRCRKKVLHA